MFRVIKIGEMDVPMLALASTNLCYRDIFHEDPVRKQQAPDFDSVEAIEFFTRLAFVMNKRAELKSRKAMMELSEDDYYEWLDGIDPVITEDMRIIAEIRALYGGSSLQTSTPKNPADQ